MGDDTLDYDETTLLADIYSLAKKVKKESADGESTEKPQQRKTKDKSTLTINKFGKIKKIGFF